MDDRNGAVYVKIYDHHINKVIHKPIAELIMEMVGSQMPISFEIEALKAQAIIVRTFITRRMKIFGGDGCCKYKDADLCTDGHCGQWMNKETLMELWGCEFHDNWNKLEKVIENTEEKIITINNKPINPRFHSTCGGATENSENVDGNKTLYLRKVLCDYCINSPDYCHSLEMTLEEIEKKLNIRIPKSSPITGANIEGIIEDVRRDEEGRIVELRIGGKKFTGTQVMELLGLDSTRDECQ